MMEASVQRIVLIQTFVFFDGETVELRTLQTFGAVADALSFTRAAEALGYAQSSVTAQIKALEAELGLPLFERLGKRVVLTEAGERLRGYATKLLALEEEARLAVSGTAEPSGTLHIGAPESQCTYRLPPLLAQFRERFPRVKLIFRPGSCAELRRSVLEGSLDVAFTMDVEAEPPGLQARWISTDPIRVLARPDHPLTRLARVTPHDLAGEVVLHTEASCTYRQLFDRILAEAGVRPEVAVEWASLEAIKHSALAGMGLAVLPEMAVAAEVAAGTLVILPFEPAFTVDTQMVWHKDKWLSPALGAFLALAEERFALATA
jgi:DNA-binding transcriptional LysR family regulator